MRMADAIADGPNAGELVQAPPRGGHAGGNGVSVVDRVHRRCDAAPLQRLGKLFGQTHAFELRQIG
jgi:hypothetical protein